MRLKALQVKYPEYELGKCRTSYGSYYFQLSPSRTEFFVRIKDLAIFLIRHKADMANGNMFKAVKS